MAKKKEALVSELRTIQKIAKTSRPPSDASDTTLRKYRTVGKQINARTDVGVWSHYRDNVLATLSAVTEMVDYKKPEEIEQTIEKVKKQLGLIGIEV